MDSEKAESKNYDKMKKVPHDGLEVVLNLMPFGSSSVVELTFLYLNCWKKKTTKFLRSHHIGINFISK